jgi:TetR/AcrR family transcriptional regulator
MLRGAMKRRARRPPARTAPKRRDPASTRERILEAAIGEFSRKGFSGARIDQIATAAASNIRMLYHYFGNKEALYLAVLERVYADIRSQERALELGKLDAREGMARLVDFTFSHFARNPHFISLILGENLVQARYLRRSKLVPALTSPLGDAIQDLLERGEAAGVFRKGVDPVQLYVSMVAMSFTHLSLRHTLSTIFRRDLGDPAWLAARRVHARTMLLGYLAPPGHETPHAALDVK